MAEDQVGKIFKHGGSQAIRLPRQFRIDGAEEVSIEPQEDGSILLRPITCSPETRTLRETWADDPRAAFESVMTTPLFPAEPMGKLMAAGVLPISSKPNGLKDTTDIHPAFNARWSFRIGETGWLDAWKLLTLLKHEDYLVQALVGLGIPLDRIAMALAMVSSRSAWGGLGAVGWLWMYAQSESGRCAPGTSNWHTHIYGIAQLAEEAGFIPQNI